MPDGQTRTPARWLWPLAIVVLFLIFFGVRHLTQQALPVRVATVQREDLTRTTSTNGKVEPQNNFEAHAPASGVVSRLYIHAGDHVRAGELLLALEDADAASRVAAALAGVSGAQASLAALKAGGSHAEQIDLRQNITKAQSDVATAEKDLETLRKLQAQGAASPDEVANAQQTFNAARLNLEGLEKRKSDPYGSDDLAHARAALADAKATYTAARAVVDQSNVRAPFAGTVYSLPVSQTEYVQQGQELLQLADLTKLQVRAYFDEPEIGSLQVGQAAQIVWDAKPGYTWKGHVVRLPSTIINYGTRNVGETLIAIDSPVSESPNGAPRDNGGLLLPNVNVTVTVTTQRVHDALTIPRDALHREAGVDYVFLVSHGRLVRRDVRTGAINLTQVQVQTGLAQGDVVALGTGNGDPLAEGEPIRVIQ